jgi:hypothetical protein
MKQNSRPPGLFQIFLAQAALIFFASCAGMQQHAETAGTKPVYRSFSHSETKNLNGLRVIFKFTLLDFKSPPALREAAGEALYGGSSPLRYAEDTAAAFAARLSGDMGGEDKFSREEKEWEYFEQFSVKGQSPDYLSLCRERYYYTGGAHGNDEETFFVIGLKDMDLLSLDDIVADSTSAALAGVINSALRHDYELDPSAPLSGAGFLKDEASVPDSFYLSSSGGLVFHWNRYEIAPYAMGPVEVSVRGEQLSGLLTPRGEELLKSR